MEPPIDSPETGATVGPVSESEVTFCYRHGERRSGVICQRCDRPICGACMTQASVGFHCPECARTGRQQVIRGPVAFDPIVTKGLIGFTVGVSLLALAWGGSYGRLTGRAFVELAQVAPFLDQGDQYRLVTSVLVHDGVLSLAISMYILWAAGREVETTLGRVHLPLIYVVAHLGGSAAALLVAPLEPFVGSIGASFGLVGALAVNGRTSGLETLRRYAPMIVIIGVLSVLGSARSAAMLLGGFATGALVALIVERGSNSGHSLRVTVGAVSLLGVGLFGLCLWAAAQWIDPLF